jgi:hypothetical protein
VATGLNFGTLGGIAGLGKFLIAAGIGSTPAGWVLVGATGTVALISLMVMLAKYQTVKKGGESLPIGKDILKGLAIGVAGGVGGAGPALLASLPAIAAQLPAGALGALIPPIASSAVLLAVGGGIAVGAYKDEKALHMIKNLVESAGGHYSSNRKKAMEQYAKSDNHKACFYSDGGRLWVVTEEEVAERVELTPDAIKKAVNQHAPPPGLESIQEGEKIVQETTQQTPEQRPKQHAEAARKNKNLVSSAKGGKHYGDKTNAANQYYINKTSVACFYTDPTTNDLMVIIPGGTPKDPKVLRIGNDEDSIKQAIKDYNKE